ncbi:mCG114005 [Mus musculus]|nr:mCG114005 [Mus musculus]
MSYTFDWLSKDVVKKLQGRDLRPVKCLSDATKFCLFNILQETSSRLALKTEYIPVGFTLLHLLEPNIPVPEPEVSAPIPLKHTISQKLKADLDVETIAGGEAGFVKSCGYDIEVQSKSIPNPKLESLQNRQDHGGGGGRKLLDQLPTFMKTCWKDGKNLYVVTEAYEVTKDTVLEGTSNSKFAIKGIINQLVKVGGSGQWQTEKTDSIPIQKGSVLAYKKQQLVIEDNTCVILTSANTKKKMTFPMRFVGMSGHLRYQDLVIETGSWINDIDPIGTIKEPTHLGECVCVCVCVCVFKRGKEIWASTGKP